jgi:transglutaminase superfamily protein
MTRDRVSLLRKASLVLRSWFWFAAVWFRLRRRPIPAVVAGLSNVERPATVPVAPRRLGRIVARSLSVGPWRVRCLFTSIVLFRLLRAQGDDAELVIGLPLEPRDKDAHAWVELAGRDVGPPPGRGRHEELARYG